MVAEKGMIWLHGAQILGGAIKSIGIKDGRIAAISDCEAEETSCHSVGHLERPATHATRENSPSAGGEDERFTHHPSELRMTRDGYGCSLHFESCIVFAGLINSHDHLDFNLFPRLGNRIYANYVEWGRDIHAVNRKEIDAVLKVPREIRWQWGIYKNLLNGITTVVNHGPRLPCSDASVSVFQKCYSLHSVMQEPRWRWRLNRPIARPWPYVIHVGEGTDGSAQDEIETLLRWNLFKRRLIAIHGVAMTQAQAASFAALIWCPASNFFLLNKTPEVEKLGKSTPIIFGTDSTLTASWNIWEQLRFARSLRMMPDETLFRAVTRTPARVWKLYDRGELREGFQADIVVANCPKSGKGYAPFFEVGPQEIVLVMSRGRIVLCDEARYQQASVAGLAADLIRVDLEYGRRYVARNLSALIGEIRRYAPEIRFQPEMAC
jgi:cytosine/adenosine deaminase-related metal-dependent hydrolase